MKLNLWGYQAAEYNTKRERERQRAISLATWPGLFSSMTSHYKSKVFDSWGLFLFQDLHADVEDQSPQHTEEMVAEGDGANQLYDTC